MPEETEEVNKKSFGRKNLNSTHFKTFVKNHVKKNETEEVIISELLLAADKYNILGKDNDASDQE